MWYNCDEAKLTTCSEWRTAHALPCIINWDNSAVFLSFVPGDFDLWPLTLTFKFVRARDQTRLRCKFGANLFSRSRDIWATNKMTNMKSHTALKRSFTCVRWRTENKIDFERKHAYRQVTERRKTVKWASENLRYAIITQESKTEQNVPLAPRTESVNTNFIYSPLETSVRHNHELKA